MLLDGRDGPRRARAARQLVLARVRGELAQDLTGPQGPGDGSANLIQAVYHFTRKDGDLARLDADERARAAAAAEAPGSSAGARRGRPRPSRPRRRRSPPTSPGAPSGRSGPRSGARRRRRSPPRRAAGWPDPTKTPLVADTLRGIARQHAQQPGAAPRQARALTYDQVRELMLAARYRRRPRARVRGDGRPAGARRRRDRRVAVLRRPAARRGLGAGLVAQP